MAPALQPPFRVPSEIKARHFAIVSALYDFSADMDLLGTVTVRILPTAVRAQEDGYSPDEDAVESLEEVDLETGLNFALARAAQVEIELEGLGSYYVGERPWDGAVEWPPSPPVRLRPFAPRAPWKTDSPGGPRQSWLITIQVLSPVGPIAESGSGPLDAWAREHGWSVDTTSRDAYLAELVAAPMAPDGSRTLYTPHSPAVQLERELSERTYAEAIQAGQGIQLPEGHKLGRVAAEPVGRGDRGWQASLRHGDRVVTSTPSVDLASGDTIAAGTEGTVVGSMTGGGQRPRYRMQLDDRRTTTVTQSQLLLAGQP